MHSIIQDCLVFMRLIVPDTINQCHNSSIHNFAPKRSCSSAFKSVGKKRFARERARTMLIHHFIILKWAIVENLSSVGQKNGRIYILFLICSKDIKISYAVSVYLLMSLTYLIKYFLLKSILLIEWNRFLSFWNYTVALSAKKWLHSRIVWPRDFFKSGGKRSTPSLSML